MTPTPSPLNLAAAGAARAVAAQTTRAGRPAPWRPAPVAARAG